MTRDLDELNRLVGTMPREMAREVLNFARHLQRKLARAAEETAEWDDDSRFGADDGFDAYHPMDRWDAVAPAGVKDVA